MAGVNADFFDINNSGAAIGPEIQGGAVRKSGIGSHAGRRCQRRAPRAAGEADARRHRASSRPARARSRALDDPAPTSAPTASPPTRRSGARTRAPAASRAPPTSPRSIVTDGKVAAVNPTDRRIAPAARQQRSRSSAASSGALALRALQVGDAVTLACDLKTDIAEPAGRSPSAATPDPRQGRRPAARVPVVGTDGPAPRTAIGFKDGGKTLLLVTADGRQSHFVARPDARARPPS